MMSVPPRFAAALESVQNLARHARYEAAFVFGSVARGEADELSDFDVKVLTDEPVHCGQISHPHIGGVKFDITFGSLAQLEDSTIREMAQGERLPMLAESVVVFDKTGRLTRLRETAQTARRKHLTAADAQSIQFWIYHLDDKAARFLETDPTASLLTLHVGVNDLLHFHYQIQERWWVSSKRLIADLHAWDAPLATLLEQFVRTQAVGEKYALWTSIIEHILRPLGGRLPIAENNCRCEACQGDLARLLES